MKTQMQSFVLAWGLIFVGHAAMAQTSGPADPDDVRAAVYNYNNPLTGKEVMGPAGPLPTQGWLPSEDDVLNVRKLGANRANYVVPNTTTLT